MDQTDECHLERRGIREQSETSIVVGDQNTLESAFDEATNLMSGSGIPHLVEKFRPRVKDIVSTTVDIGWGFHEHLEDVFYSEYPGEDAQ